MSQPGFSVMLHYLSGGNPNDPQKYVGKVIVAAALENNELLLSFEDGLRIKLWDDGQSCCESRYITTDDDLSVLVGKELLAITSSDGPSKSGEYGEDHDTAFVRVQASDAEVTLCTHVEHNGYYGGFGLRIDEI